MVFWLSTEDDGWQNSHRRRAVARPQDELGGHSKPSARSGAWLLVSYSAIQRRCRRRCNAGGAVFAEGRLDLHAESYLVALKAPE